MNADYQPTMREIYDLVLSLREVTELGFARIDKHFDAVEARFERIPQPPDGIETS